jgi:hypothetical protein
MQQQQQVSGRFRIDPAAVATYSAAMGRVSDQLTEAAGRLDGATVTAALVAELGAVGADFAADFGEILDAHRDQWAFGAHLLGEYSKVMDSFTAVARAVDEDLADAIRRGSGDQ